jgi:signal peptidase I
MQKQIKKIIKWTGGLTILKIVQAIFLNIVISGSMLPTMEYKGLKCINIVNIFAYGVKLPLVNKTFFKQPYKRGDVVLFYDRASKKKFVKRVVGLPGDRITLSKDLLYINGKCVTGVVDQKATMYYNSKHYNQLMVEGGSIQLRKETLDGKSYYVQYTMRLGKPSNDFYEFVVGEDQLFLLGDNRNDSMDSRFIGPINSDQLIGRAFIIQGRSI